MRGEINKGGHWCIAYSGIGSFLCWKCATKRKRMKAFTVTCMYRAEAEGAVFNTVCLPLRFSHFRPAIKLTGGMLFDQSKAYLLPALLIYSEVVASFQGYVTTVATVAVFTNSQLELTT